MTTDNQQTDSTEKTIEAGDLTKLLQEYRNIAHLDIDQIADSLCLTSSAINALENEDFSKLPESPYVRGYLRNYARLANKDHKQVIKVYNTLRGEPTEEDNARMGILASGGSHEVATPLITTQRFRLMLLAALLLLLGLLTMIPGVKDWGSNLWNNFSTSSENTPVTEDSLNLPSLTGDVPGNLPISPDEPDNETELDTDATEPEATTDTAEDSKQATPENTDNADNKTTEAETEVATAKTQNDPAATNTKEEKAAANTKNTPNEQEIAAVEGNTKLKFIFTQEVWLRIKGADGSIVYEALHPAGTEKQLSLNSPLTFKVGNAPAMQLFVNGKVMDTSEHTKGSVARFSIE